VRRKNIKARLNSANLSIPKTHDLEILLDLVLPVELRGGIDALSGPMGFPRRRQPSRTTYV
jgi:hypothetical protein